MVKVLALVEHLEDDLGLQANIEESGSPDSFHVHVPIWPTDVETVHRFVKAVLAVMKKKRPDLDWDIEAFPKQATSKSPFGSNVKLPLSINRRTGIRS
jgi:DNA primase